MSAFGGKADIGVETLQCPLMTQSGHLVYAPPYTPDASLTRALSEIGRDRGTVEAGMSRHDETV